MLTKIYKKSYFSYFSSFQIFRVLHAPNIPYAQKSFWMHLMVLLGHEARMDAHFSPFEDSANLDARLVYGLHQM
jgi:hypothetical protein